MYSTSAFSYHFASHTPCTSCFLKHFLYTLSFFFISSTLLPLTCHYYHSLHTWSYHKANCLRPTGPSQAPTSAFFSSRSSNIRSYHCYTTYSTRRNLYMYKQVLQRIDIEVITCIHFITLYIQTNASNTCILYAYLNTLQGQS